MKKLISLFACAAIFSGMMSFSAAAETGQVYWFGTNENGYTEDFEGDVTALEIESGHSYMDGTANRVITGAKSYTIESNSTKGKANICYSSDDVFNSGIVNVKFAARVRVRDGSADTSISIVEDNAVFSAAHMTDYVLQIKNNGTNFELYANGAKQGDLSTNSTAVENISDIIYVDASIDLDNCTANVVGTLKSSDGIQKDRKEFNIENLECNNIGGIHMTSLDNYTSLIVDDIYVAGDESAVVEPEPMPEGVYADESFDSFTFGKLTMGSNAVSVSNQNNTVTLGINKGRNGGDSSTYLQTGGADDKYITFHSGRFADKDRHPFLSINSAPSFSELEDMDFVLECDINMNGKDSVPVMFGDGSNGISFALKDGVININGTPAEGTSKNTWYHIVITADDSKCDVSINGSHISTSLNGAQKLSRIDFGKNTADGGDLMAINNLKAYSSKKTSASVGEIKKLNDEIIIGDDGFFANAYNFTVDPGDFSVNKVTVNVNDTPQTKTTNISQGPCVFGIIILSADPETLTAPQIDIEIE